MGYLSDQTLRETHSMLAAIGDSLNVRESSEGQERPRVVCLCGSTRFFDAFQRANYEETMAGRIVLSVGHYPNAPREAHGENVGCTPEQKIALDELHKRKIDLADEVFVLNVGGYIGDSTRSEIAYAVRAGKPVRYLDPEAEKLARYEAALKDIAVHGTRHDLIPTGASLWDDGTWHKWIASMDKSVRERAKAALGDVALTPGEVAVNEA